MSLFTNKTSYLFLFKLCCEDTILVLRHDFSALVEIESWRYDFNVLFWSHIFKLRFKTSGYLIEISLIYTISMDPDTKFEKIYHQSIFLNILPYFTNFWIFILCFNLYFTNRYFTKISRFFRFSRGFYSNHWSKLLLDKKKKKKKTNKPCIKPCIYKRILKAVLLNILTPIILFLHVI